MYCISRLSFRYTLYALSVLPIIPREKVSVEKCLLWGARMRGEHLLHSLFEKSQMRKDNDNRPSTAMNLEISVDIGSVYRQVIKGLDFF